MITARKLTVMRAARTVIADIALDLRTGELTVVLGPNGAGKSTLVHALAGLLAPGTGSVAYDDVDLLGYDARALARRRAVLTQDVDVAFDFSAIELVTLGRAPHADRSDEAARIAMQALASVHAAHLAHRRMASLSGGERQRIHLARVLTQLWPTTSEPRALFLDEPTASQDLHHQHAILATAARFAHAGNVCVAVLHDLNLALRHADRVIIVRDGALTLDRRNDARLDARILSDALGIPLRSVAANERFMTLEGDR